VRFFRPVPRVSLAQPADARALADLYAEIWRPWAGVLDRRFIDEQLASPEEIRVWLTGGFELYRATYEGRLAGAVRLSFPTGTCLLDRLAVAEQTRRKGFGQVLAEHSVSRAKRAGASRVWVLVSPKLEAAAGLFRGLGFKETSRFVADYWGEEVALLELGV
jgi:ribosomal protein S18 acetylase RimI-like enzyme